MENSSENIVELIRDYVGHHLRKKGIEWGEYAAVPSSSTYMSKLKYSIRLLCDEFEHTYNSVFIELCNEIEVTPAKAKVSFLSVVDELFVQGVKWGRLVALFSLAGALSHICITKGNSHLINYIIEWTKIYFVDNLIHWIEIHHGWVSHPPSVLKIENLSFVFFIFVFDAKLTLLN